MNLSAQDVAGAIAELSRAVAQLAAEADVPSVHRRTELSDTEELEISRLQLSHPRLLRQEQAVYSEGDFRETSAAEEVLRLTATFPREFGAGVSRSGGGVSRRPGARARRDSQTLALSAASPGGAALVSKWGLPIAVAGVPVTSENAGRLGLGNVLSPLVVDVTDDPAQDISSWVGRRTGGLGDGYDQPPDMGATDPGFGQEYDQPGALNADSGLPWRRGSIDDEVDRLVQTHGSAIAGLRTGAKRHTDGQGEFTSRVPGRQARLTGTLSGPV